MNPQLFFDHARCEATQDFDAERGFDVAKQENDIVPTNAIRRK
jgi:hypothetical protein